MTSAAVKMSKKLLLTGATDGIGLETAKRLVEQGHTLLLHGRNTKKLQALTSSLSKCGTVESYVADLSDIAAVRALAAAVAAKHRSLDVLINNAGVLQTPHPVTENGIDRRFAVNTIAPYWLTKDILPLLAGRGRVINVSSAAQAPVDVDALTGNGRQMEAMSAYSQSKLAMIMWSRALANSLNHGRSDDSGAMIMTINPGSLLGSKMVKEGFGIAGKDIRIGADSLIRAALSDEFSHASGRYFDNDIGRFANPHPDALDEEKCRQIVAAIERMQYASLRRRR